MIYTVTFDPDLRIGIRLHRDDADNDDLGSIDPTWFGGDIADSSIGEPLGTVMDHLRTDERGMSWWGDLDAELPTTPT